MFIYLWRREASPYTAATEWSPAVWRPWTPTNARFSPRRGFAPPSPAARFHPQSRHLGDAVIGRVSRPLKNNPNPCLQNEFLHPRTGEVELHFPELISLLWTSGRLGTTLTSFHIRYNEGSFSLPLQSFSSSLVLVKPLTKTWFGLCCFCLSQCWVMMMATFSCH